MTTDLHNLLLHSDYDETYDVIVGNGKNLKITHTCSTKLPMSPSKSCVLSNVLCVPDMLRNLISVLSYVGPIMFALSFHSCVFWLRIYERGSHYYTVRIEEECMNGLTHLHAIKHHLPLFSLQVIEHL